MKSTIWNKEWALGFALLHLACWGSQGQTIFHVRAGATGLNNGSDWNNAYATLPATLVRGATYYVADGNYPGYTFDDPASGTDVITLQKATDGEHGSAAGWSNAYGDGVAVFGGQVTFATPNYVMDGVVGTFKSGHGFHVSLNSRTTGVWITADNITLRHTKVSWPDRSNLSHIFSIAIECRDWTGTGYGHHEKVTLEHVFINEIPGAPVRFINFDKVLMDHCVIYGQYTIEAEHASFVIVRNNPCNDGTIRNCWFEDGTALTGGITFYDVAHYRWKIHGNVFKNLKTGQGIITSNHHPLGSGYLYDSVICNNTVDMLQNAGSNGGFTPQDGGNNVAYNNVFYRCHWLWLTGGGVMTANFNYYADCWFGGGWNPVGANDTTWTPNPRKQSTITASPFVNADAGDYHLVADMAAWPGLGLAAPYDVDPDGVTRGRGAWDRGAFEFAAGGPDTTGPVISSASAVNLTAGSAAIAFATSEGARWGINFGVTTNYGNNFTNAAFATSHSLPLTGLSANTVYHYRITVTDVSGNATRSTDFTFQTAQPAAPDTNAPSMSAIVVGSITTTSAVVSLTTSEAARTSVQYGATTSYGAALTNNNLVLTRTLSITGLLPNTTYHYRLRATDASNNTSTNADATFQTLQLDLTAPVVSFSVPANGAAVSNAVSLTASATDNIGVVDVVFLVDGVQLGSAVASPPYRRDWNTIPVANGPHTLVARARDALGNQQSAQVTVTVQNALPDLTTGLVGHWNFDEDSGAATADLSRNGNAAMLMNNPSRVAGKFKKGVSLTGTNYVTVAHSASLESPAFSVTVWVKRVGDPGGQTLVSKLAVNDSSGYGLYVIPSGQAMFYVASGGASTILYSTAVITPGVWHHVVGTFDGTTARIFVDGLEESSKAGAKGATTEPLYFGMEDGGTASSTWPLNGVLDDIRIYNRALPVSVVAAFFNARESSQSPPLLRVVAQP